MSDDNGLDQGEELKAIIIKPIDTRHGIMWSANREGAETPSFGCPSPERALYDLMQSEKED